MWPFNIFITLAIPIGGGLWWLALNRKEIYNKLFFPLIILVGVVLIFSLVWDLSNSTTMSALIPYVELDKANDARGAVDNVRIFSGLFLLNCSVTVAYLCLLRRFAESDSKKSESGIQESESGNKKSLSLLQRFAELGKKKPLKKRRKNRRRGKTRKR
jgi:hypothetical protein